MPRFILMLTVMPLISIVIQTFPRRVWITMLVSGMTANIKMNFGIHGFMAMTQINFGITPSPQGSF